MKIKDQERLMKAVERVLAHKIEPVSLGDGIGALWDVQGAAGMEHSLWLLREVYRDVDAASRA